MGITTSGNRYQGAKRKKDPVVVMKEGGQASEILKMNYAERLEYLNKNHIPNIIDAGYYFMYYSGFEYPLNDDSSKTKSSILEYFKEKSSFTTKTLDENTIYRMDDWAVIRKEIDPEDDSVYDTTELRELISDNTSNYEYKGLIDLNYRLYYDEDYDKYILVIHPHLGGDIRGNYGEPFILMGSDKDELLDEFNLNYVLGNAIVFLKFKDDSELTFTSENCFDVYDFKLSSDLPKANSMAGKYLNDYNKFTGSDADDFLEETIQKYDNLNPKMELGGGVYDEIPKAYIQILGYPEGKWITISDFSDGEDVMNHIYDWMKSLNSEKGGNREEYEVHDYEGFGRKLYSEGMGESEFDEIIEGYELYEKSDFPSAIIDEYMKDNGFEEYDDAIEDMNSKYNGSYESLSDLAKHLVNEGIYVPSTRYMFVTDTDKRIISSEEADSKVEEMDANELLELVDKYNEFKDEKEKLENDLNVNENKLDTIVSYIDKAEGDEDLLEKLTDEHSDISDIIDSIKNKLEVLEDVYVQKYKDDAVSIISKKIYDKLENDLSGFLSEYGYMDDLTNIPFVNIDYDSIGKELKHDYNIYEENGRIFTFKTYEKGGKVVRMGKPNPKYKYYVIENNSNKIVSAWEHKDDAIDSKNELKKENPKLSFGVYQKDKAEIKFGVDTMTYRDWIDLTKLDALSKANITTKKEKFEYGGSTLQPVSRWDKTKHYARRGVEETKSAFQDVKDWTVRNDVRGKIGRGFQSAVDKTKQGASWLKQKWHDADFGDGKGKAKFFAEGGEVEFITYNGNEIMYSPHFNQYFVDDEPFNTLDEAKAYIDKGSPISEAKRDAYRRGYFKKGGITTKSEEDIFNNKNMLLNQANELAHHSDELNKIVKKQDKVASWVVAKMERANTDVSDVTHYLDGNKKFENGGSIEDEIDYLDRRIKSLEEDLTIRNEEDLPRLQETIDQLKREKEYLINKSRNPEEKPKKKFWLFNDGGMVDLFEDYDNIPENVQSIIDEYDLESPEYSTLEELQGRLKEVGYTFDYGMDSQPYGLRPVGVEINELDGYEDYENGGSVDEQYVVFYENENGEFRKLSEHFSYRGAKSKMDKLWRSGDYENLGIENLSDWNNSKAKYSFENGGTISEEEKKQNDLCIDVFVDFVTNICDVNYAFTDKYNNKLVFVLDKEPMIDTIHDMNEFLHISNDDCSNVFLSDVEFNRENKVLTISLKPEAYTTFGEGGTIPEKDKMFHLPLEMVVYVPSTQDVDKVITVDEMDKRVDEVKTYLSSKFGGYSSTDKLGGFVDSKGNLVNEEVVQVVSFSTQEAFDEHKDELVKQLSKWGQEWGQEAIGFEFEGDLFYVPQEGQMMKEGGEVWIQDAINRMKSKNTVGAFTKQAKRHKKTPVEFAKEVIAKPEYYTTRTFRRAMFVKNTNPELF